jgi:hypothetical protein
MAYAGVLVFPLHTPEYVFLVELGEKAFGAEAARLQFRDIQSFTE